MHCPNCFKNVLEYKTKPGVPLNQHNFYRPLLRDMNACLIGEDTDILDPIKSGCVSGGKLYGFHYNPIVTKAVAAFDEKYRGVRELLRKKFPATQAK